MEISDATLLRDTADFLETRVFEFSEFLRERDTTGLAAIAAITVVRKAADAQENAEIADALMMPDFIEAEFEIIPIAPSRETHPAARQASATA